jgi:hypothetical protein
MKKTLSTLLSVLFCAITFAQSVPQGINYQAVARDASGNVLMNQALTIRFSVIADIADTTNTGISWQETHTVSTNDYGLYTAIIGQGTHTGGSSLTFDVVDWGASNHLLKVEVDYGSGFVDMGTTAFMSVPYALYSATGSSTSTCGLSIGDTTQGGIIFYLDPSGCHGLVCALTDQSSGTAWYNVSYIDTRAYGSGLFEGKYNTKMINWEQGGSTSASAICAAYTVGSFNDWYLPSIEELNKMYLNIGQGNALGLGNIGGFAGNSCWSSTEFDNYYAWYQNFGNGYQDFNVKDDGRSVRAVRAF